MGCECCFGFTCITTSIFHILVASTAFFFVFFFRYCILWRIISVSYYGCYCPWRMRDNTEMTLIIIFFSRNDTIPYIVKCITLVHQYNYIAHNNIVCSNQFIANDETRLPSGVFNQNGISKSLISKKYLMHPTWDFDPCMLTISASSLITWSTLEKKQKKNLCLIPTWSI